MKEGGSSDCVFLNFDCAAAANRSAEIRRRGDHGVLVSFERRTAGRHGSRRAEEDARACLLNGWDLIVEQRSSESARFLGNASTDEGFVIAGLKAAAESLGICGIEIPRGAARHMGRSLSYRLPTETWNALHNLDGDEHDRLLMAMASALHDGRVRECGSRAQQMGRGHLQLPMELAGEAKFAWEARTLVRMLPCIGLDRWVERPGDYEILFTYEGDGAMDSPEYMPLIGGFRKARSKFVRELGISTEEDLVEFIGAYGRSCRLLGDEASAAFRDADFIRETARQVVQLGPGRAISDWQSGSRGCGHFK